MILLLNTWSEGFQYVNYICITRPIRQNNNNNNINDLFLYLEQNQFLDLDLTIQECFAPAESDVPQPSQSPDLQEKSASLKIALSNHYTGVFYRKWRRKQYCLEKILTQGNPRRHRSSVFVCMEKKPQISLQYRFDPKKEMYVIA